MSNKLGIQLDIEFKDTAKSLDDKLKKLLNQMENNKITVGVDESKLTSEFNKIKKKYDAAIKELQGKKAEVAPKVDTKAMFASMNEITKKYEQLGKFDIGSKWRDGQKEIQKFTAQLTEAKGDVEKISNFTFEKVDGGFNIKGIKEYEREIKKVSDATKKVTETSRESVKEIGKLENISQNMNKRRLKIVDGEDVQRVYDLQNGLKQTLKIVQNLQTGKVTTVQTDDVKGMYSELSKAQKEAFNIEKQMIGASEEMKGKLHERLEIVQGIIGQYTKLTQQEQFANKYEQEKIASQKQFLANQVEILKLKNQEKQSKSAYSELERLTKEEYNIRNKMVGVEENVRSIRSEQLRLIQEQQTSIKAMINTNGLTDEQRKVELLRTQNKLKSELNTKNQVESNKQELETQNNLYRQIETSVKAIGKARISMVNAGQNEMSVLQGEVEKHRQILDVLDRGKLSQQQKNSLTAMESKYQDDLRSKVAQTQDSQTSFVKKMEAEITVLKNKYGSIFSDPKVKADLQELQRLLSASGRVNMAGANAQFKQLRASISESNKALRMTQNESMGVKEALTQAFQKFPLWISVSTIVMGAVHSFKQGVESVVEFDSQMTTLTFTMDTTESNFESMGIAAENYSKKLGSTISQTMEAIKVYTNMNETVDGILRKSQAGIVLSNLSGLSTTESTDAVQAMVNQFELADDQAMQLVDSLTSISASMGMDFGKSFAA